MSFKEFSNLIEDGLSRKNAPVDHHDNSQRKPQQANPINVFELLKKINEIVWKILRNGFEIFFSVLIL